MALGTVARGVEALAAQLNSYYRVLKGVDPDSVFVRLLPGGVSSFEVRHSGTNAPIIKVADAGVTGVITPADGTVTNPKLVDGAVDSRVIADGTIVNADVNAAAGIVVTKLAPLGANNVLKSNPGGTANVAGQVVNADVAASGTANIAVNKLADLGANNVLRSDGAGNVAGKIVSADITDGTIVNADINAGAGIVPSKLAAISTGQILKDVGAGVVGGGLLRDVNVDTAGTANIAVNKLADLGANNVLRSSGAGNVAGKVVSADIQDLTIVDGDIAASAAIAITKLADVGANNVLRSNGSGNVAGKVVTNDMAINSINGDRLLDGSVPGAKISGGAPPPNGTGAADAWKAYATDAAGTTVSLRTIATEMLATDAVVRRYVISLTGASGNPNGAWAVIASLPSSPFTGYPVRLDLSCALNSSAGSALMNLGYRVDGGGPVQMMSHSWPVAGAWCQISAHIWVALTAANHVVDILWYFPSPSTLSMGGVSSATLTEYKKAS